MKEMNLKKTTTVLLVLASTVVFAEIGPVNNEEDQFRFFYGTHDGVYEKVRDIGFNTIIGGGHKKEAFGKMVADGIGWICQLNVAGLEKLKKKYPRYNRDGSVDDRTMDPWAPGAMDEMRILVREKCLDASKNPACIGIQPASELRIRTHPSFNERHAAAYRAYSGHDVPPEAQWRQAPHWRTLKGIPSDRIIPDDFPVYDFYRWFWTVDDGFGAYFNMAVEETEKAFGREVLTMYDPCIRCPPAWSKGSRIKFINEWQTNQPVPFQQSYIVSKEKAMSRQAPGQRVFTMVQGIFARNDSCPPDVAPQPKNLPAWVADRPKGRWITPPPDMMREAFWSVFTRQIDGFGVHGWNCIFDGVPHGLPKDGDGYQFTNPETAEMMADLFHRVAIPLGPMFKAAPEREPEVAVLESLPSTLLSNKAPYDWKLGFDTLQTGITATGANLSPYTLYDDEINGPGIPSSIKVILAPEASILTRTTAENLRKFQARGGKILAREDFAPGMKADGVLPPTRVLGVSGMDYEQARNNPNFDPVEYDRQIHAAIADFTAAVAPFVERYVMTTDSHLLAAVRKAGTGADLVFAYNVKRTLGDYIGQWRKVLDRGAPNSGEICVRRKAAAVYDLVNRKAVSFRVERDQTVIPVFYQTTDGSVFLLAEKPLGKILFRAETRDGMLHCGAEAKADVMRPIAVNIPGRAPFYAVITNGRWTKDFSGATADGVTLTDIATGEVVESRK